MNVKYYVLYNVTCCLYSCLFLGPPRKRDDTYQGVILQLNFELLCHIYSIVYANVEFK